MQLLRTDYSQRQKNFVTPRHSILKNREILKLFTEHPIYSKIILENFETFSPKMEMQKNIWKIETGLY